MASVPWAHEAIIKCVMTVMAGIGPRDVHNSFLSFLSSQVHPLLTVLTDSKLML